MLTKGEKGILFLLDCCNGQISKLRLVKLLFLISKRIALYDFMPYKYGPFSFQLYHDLSRLERDEFVSTDDNSVFLANRDLPKIDSKVKNIIRMNSQRFATLDDGMLLDHIYEKYPEYTIFSLYRRTMEYERDSAGITTIGYEGKSIDRFLLTLVENKIGKLIDVRKNPFSMNYGYTKSQLEKELKSLGISYIHLPELGIDSDQRQNLSERGFVELFQRYAMELGAKEDLLDTIKSLAQKEKVALMCFEAKESDCHRGVIAKRFRDEGLDVVAL